MAAVLMVGVDSLRMLVAPRMRTVICSNKLCEACWARGCRRCRDVVSFDDISHSLGLLPAYSCVMDDLVSLIGIFSIFLCGISWFDLGYFSDLDLCLLPALCLKVH